MGIYILCKLFCFKTSTEHLGQKIKAIFVSFYLAWSITSVN